MSWAFARTFKTTCPLFWARGNLRGPHGVAQHVRSGLPTAMTLLEKHIRQFREVSRARHPRVEPPGWRRALQTSPEDPFSAFSRGLSNSGDVQSDKARQRTRFPRFCELCRVGHPCRTRMTGPEPYKPRRGTRFPRFREVCPIRRTPNPTKLAESPDFGSFARFVGPGASCQVASRKVV